MFYTYVLYNFRCKRFYIGYSSDLKRRISEHKNGNVKSTTNRDLKLIFYEAYLSKKDAIRRERYLKTTKGKKTLRNMLHDSLHLS